MLSSLEPYSIQRDSGIGWLGNIPSHWSLRRVKFLLRERDQRAGDSNGTLLSLTRTRGIVATSDVSTRIARVEDLSNYKICRPGDLVMNRMQAWSGMFSVSQHCGVVSPDYSVFEPRIPTEIRFFEYLFKTPLMVSECGRRSKGIGSGFNRLYADELGDIKVAIPPLNEQKRIVSFLDSIDRNIQDFIYAKQRLILFLEEKKRAIIDRAVTRGISSTARMKSSGIDWLGDIPEDWKSARLKAVLLRPIRNGIFKQKDQFGNGSPLINVADVYEDYFRIDPSSLEKVGVTPDERRRFCVRSGDILFVRSSLKVEGIGRTVIVLDCSPDTVFECHLVQARPDSTRVDSRYLVLYLNSSLLRTYLISQCNVVTMATIAQNAISACPILIPPLAEQKRLVQWIDAQWNEMAQAIEHVKRQINYVREYRTRLISNVITGKLDIHLITDKSPDHFNTVEQCDNADV